MTGDAEPVVAVAATPREWGQALHRHLADHGGARLRATVLHPDDALAEDYDVLVADDATSFLTHRLVAELARRDRMVLGVFDPDDPAGKERLVDLGVADVTDRHAEPAELLARVVALVATAERTDDHTGPVEANLPAPPRRTTGGRVVVVAGAAGGSGASETALTLADVAGAPGRPAALVDADAAWPSLAQRLGCGLYPNVVAAADAVARGHERWAELLQRPAGGRVALLAGASHDHAETAGESLTELVDALAGAFALAVVDLAAGPEALAGPAGRDAAAGLAARADRVVAVADASPCGAARLLGWLAAADGVVEPARVHVAFNRSDADAFRRRELDAEVARVAGVAGVWHLPSDARVARAAWDGAPVATGAYRRAVATLAAGLAPDLAPRRRRRWRWPRAGTGARA